MKGSIKKLLCAVTGAAMIISALPSAVSADGADGAVTPVFYTSFDESGAGTGSYDAEIGGRVTEHGAVSYAESWNGGDNKALSIQTNAAGNYLELPKGLLDGADAATFTFWIKPASGWAFMTTPVAGSQDYLNEKYIGMLANASYTAERYNNSGVRLSSVSAEAADDWQFVAAVTEEGGTRLYINGRLAASDSAKVNVKELFSASASTWIGHGNWGSGEGFSGMIDDFSVWKTALPEETIADISSDGAEYEKQRNVSENNCRIFNTRFYAMDTETAVFDKNLLPFTEPPSTTSGGFKAVSEVKNYAGDDCEVSVSLSYIGRDGAKNQIAQSGAVPIKSGEKADITVTVPDSAFFSVPGDAAGIVADAVVTTEAGETPYEEIAVLYAGVKAPEKTAADPENGAHDPSIVKFDGDNTYYVYSSHHLIFTSEDLIHWQKHDFTSINAKDISPKTYDFIKNNYTNTEMNGTYWAPDVIYREGDDHPYWMYMSLSCGLGGRNSTISLAKSDSSLFWADKNADIIDAGVVFATKETNNYKTNAIDANIYTDSNDGRQYFVWGSFWGGIQAAPLTDAGLVEGIDYTSDTTILNTCAKFGTSVFTQKNGVAGPEGAWMIEHDGYRYMFTSYGWLGSNYNTRVARAPLSAPFSENMGTQLTDANGVVMGTEYSKGDIKGTTGYKLIGSYRLGDGSMSIINDTHDYFVDSRPGDAVTYYGPGHNSVINIGDESFYVSHTRVNHAEGGATLQVRKMLWTEDGWPVVSPVTYAGEIEQALPEKMILGTYDLASVGRTKKVGTNIGATGSSAGGLVDLNRNYDLPVLSSKVTLNADGSVTDADGGAIGGWEFDGDHTVTLTFAADGDEALDEFYKSGDVMTMYALFGYDNDAAQYVVGLTGTDQNHVTQLAKKPLSNEYRTEKEEADIPVILEKSAGGNPILGFGADGSTLYAGDPAAFVDGDTVYIIAGHDTASTEGYEMPNWVAYSSKDMKTWKYEGIAMEESSISWVNDKVSAWASQAIKYGDKYYLYYCAETKHGSGTDRYNGKSIGVAVADKPAGPYVDSGKPLILGSFTPDSSTWNDIDPTVWVETVDGVEHRYLCWGNSKLFICELNENMTSVKDINGDGNVTFGADVIEQTVAGAPAQFTEAPWIYRQQDENGNYFGKYYLFYAMGWREQMAYATADTLTNADGTLNPTWEYGGLLMPPTATSNTNHPAVIDFKGHTYFIYHNGSLPWGSGFRRSVCVEEFTINADGTIDPIQETSTGVGGTASYITHGDNYITHENFVNPGADGSYPLVKSPVSVGTAIADSLDAQWEIVNGKADEDNEYYVSIQSVNKPGLYLAAIPEQSSGLVNLTQDSKQNDTAMKRNMTFKTVKALNGAETGVSFECVSMSGYYLTNLNGILTVSNGSDADACSFEVTKADKPISGILASITDAWHNNENGAHFYLNNAVIYGSVDVYAAEYGDGGVLLGAGVRKNVPVTSMRQSMSVDYKRKSDTSELKLFVWKDMMPIANPAKITAAENPYKIPEGYTSYFEFEDNLNDSVSGAAGTVAPEKIVGTTSESAAYGEGYNGRAVSFSGAGGTGVNLGKVITNGKYTIAFRMKANAFTQFTSGVFINSGDASNQKWVSAPFGSMAEGNTMIWSNNGGYVTLDSNGRLLTDTWHHVAVAADGGTASLYIDGVKTGSGSIADIVSADTQTYLGVNFWDTPFNGLIDDLYIYNGVTLTDNDVANLFEATNK